MNRIYLIRHGEIAQSSPRKFIGQQDLPLTGHGRRQIRRMAEFLADTRISRIICSPLWRTLESAQIIGKRLRIVPETRGELQEISLGKWQGLNVAEVQSRFPGDYEARGGDMARFRPQDGESFVDLQARSWPVFEEIAREREEQVGVVAHAGVNRVILCRLLGMPLDHLFHLDQDYGCLNIIDHGRNGYRLHCLNRTF